MGGCGMDGTAGAAGQGAGRAKGRESKTRGVCITRDMYLFNFSCIINVMYVLCMSFNLRWIRITMDVASTFFKKKKKKRILS